MSIAKCYSAHLSGLVARMVTVEVDISNGLNSLNIVGLGDRAVEEAKDRVSAAIKNSGFVSPKQKNQKVIVSLAPADVKKEGPAFDLPIALSYLAAAGDIELDPDRTLFLGELSLRGELRKIAGLLPILCQAHRYGFTRAFVPERNAAEASLSRGLAVYKVSSLRETIAALAGKCPLRPVGSFDYEKLAAGAGRPGDISDMKAVRGNDIAKRGLEIAAAGAHNIILYGPPGTGKTMLAQALPSILPALSREEAVEVTGIHSAAGVLGKSLVYRPPFRSPHHTASYAAIVGGGAFPRPGEMTLAHRGVLFLDEIPEFDRSVLEALRQPLEDRVITVSRARGSVTFPAQCILVASMNPCPCGKPLGRGCICTAGTLRAYRRKISGPIMDRLDIWVNVDKVDYAKLSSAAPEIESSTEIRARVEAARLIQRDRFARLGIKKIYNSEMSAADLETAVLMTDRARAVLRKAAEKADLSGRAFHRIMKVGRTIADLSGEEAVGEKHVMEALQYRQKAEWA